MSEKIWKNVKKIFKFSFLTKTKTFAVFYIFKVYSKMFSNKHKTVE